MTTFALIPGAGGAATWLYSRVAPLLADAGHEAVPVDLSAADAAGGLACYTERVLAAVDGRPDVVLVAQSLGGFVAPLVADRTPIAAIVFLNAMIPAPGERPADWWHTTGSQPARIAAAQRGGYPTDIDVDVYFAHDVDPETWASGASAQREEPDAVFAEPCSFERWPQVTIRAVAGAHDRFFPAQFQQRLARERVGIDADILPGGHLLALSQPRALADYLLAA